MLLWLWAHLLRKRASRPQYLSSGVRRAHVFSPPMKPLRHAVPVVLIAGVFGCVGPATRGEEPVAGPITPEARLAAGAAAASLAAEIEASSLRGEERVTALRRLLSLQVKAGKLELAVSTCVWLGRYGDTAEGHSLAGQIHELRGDLKAAAEEYRAAIGDRPLLAEDDKQWTALRTFRFNYQQYQYFVNDLDAVMNKESASDVARRWRAEAHDLADKEMRKDPQFLEAIGESEAAIRIYDDMLRVNPADILPIVRKAVLHIEHKADEEARKTLRAGIYSLYRKRWEAEATGGPVYDKATITKAYEEIEKQVSDEVEGFDRIDAVVRVSRVMLVAKWPYDEIAPVITRYMDAELPDARYLAARAALAMATVESRELIASAEADLRKAVELEPEDAALYMQLADVLRFSRPIDPALKAWQRACALDPDNEDYCLTVAEKLFRYDRTTDALNTLKRFNQAHESVRVMRALMNWYYEYGDKDVAFAFCTRIQAIDPTESTMPFPRDNYDALVYFYAKTHEAFVKGQADYQARIAEEREARRAAAARQAEEREAEERRRREVAQLTKKKSWIEQFAEAVHNLPTAADNGFSAMADQNAAAGARLQRNLDAEARSNERIHEIERQFAK